MNATRINCWPAAALLGCAAALLSTAAHAADGVVLIDQSTLEAVGGFPYKITQPGSYRLSGNLLANTPLDSYLPVIEIRSDNVTLDLGGFSISGTFYVGVGTNFVGLSPVGITVRNGIIRGARAFAVDVENATGSRIEQITVSGGSGGIFAGKGSLITGNTVTSLRRADTSGFSEMIGIVALNGSTLSGNVISNVRCFNGNPAGCTGFGIRAQPYSTVSGNTLFDNDVGMRVTCPANVLGNTAGGNNPDSDIILDFPGCTRANNLPAP